MSSLCLLLEHVPSWVVVDAAKDEEVLISVDAAPPGDDPRIFKLKLTPSDEGGVSVAERPEMRQLPCFCPERHINLDGSFCLFLGSGNSLTSSEQGSAWWLALSCYLNNQAYAERLGIWPLEAGLSHGNAASIQIEMETIASSLGWRDEILKGIFRKQGWISRILPKVSKDPARVVNARTACPRGCTKLRRRRGSCAVGTGHTAISGEKFILRVDCPNRDTLERLIVLEHARRRAENELSASLRASGAVCCGSMRICPLGVNACPLS